VTSLPVVHPGALGELPFPLARTSPSDRHFDYCLQPYRPRRSPRGKLRAENLLLKALELSGSLAPALPVIEALRASLGRDMVVWGTKWDGERLFFELYIYDPQKEDPKATVSGLRETLRSLLPIGPTVAETIPYMMVSFDLDVPVFESGAVSELNLYLSDVDAHAGRSYVVSGEQMALANTYRFLEPKREIDTLLALLESSSFIDYSDPRVLGRVLLPDLFACKRVCVAKKRLRDGVYFSGLSIEQLLGFLRRCSYPAPLVAFADAIAGDLDHVYFDVGLDLLQDASGAISYPKTSFYGTF